MHSLQRTDDAASADRARRAVGGGPPRATLEIEHALGSSAPFGESSQLANRCAERTKRYLAHLAEGEPSIKRAFDKVFKQEPRYIRSILLDSLFRSTVNHARGCVALGNEPEGLPFIEPLVDDAVARVSGQSHLLPVLRVWEPDAAPPTSRGAFDMHLAKRFPALAVAAPTPEERATIQKATELIDAILPVLSQSTLFHVNLVIVGSAFDGKPFKSTTSAYWPGAIVLSTSVLSSVAHAAVNILHEATHAKYIDYEHLYAMYPPGYRPWIAPTIHPPWHTKATNPNGWPISRAATAMHVYTVLTVLFRRVLETEHDAWPRSFAMQREEECLHRATTLESLLRPHRGSLGAAGQQFLDWIRTQLTALVRSAPAATA